MKVIWAPWRMAYIKNSRKPAQCIFCSKARARLDAANLLLHRGRHGFVMMNLFPYNSGHLMVAPYAHVGSLESLSTENVLDLIQLINLSLRVLRMEIRPEGFNVGINVGKVSGAGIEAHVHVHIVPRWAGDTNFMPLFSETRVIPEHLRATYRKLRARFHMVTDEDRRQKIPGPARPLTLATKARAGRRASSGSRAGRRPSTKRSAKRSS